MNYLFRKLRGIIIALLLFINLLCLPFIVLMLGLLHVLIPIPAWHRLCRRLNQETLPPYWVRINNYILGFNRTLTWDIQYPEAAQLSTEHWYCLISNHASYADILIIDKVFGNKIPKVKFFMKRQLLWQLPVLGLACRVMGYPFLYRATKRQIKKNPQLKGRDIASIKAACQSFRERPTAMLNFLEGTRFTPEKHRRKASPYRHLLKPNIIGFGLPFHELASLKPWIINVTIVYPGHRTPSLWQFISGDIKRVVVRYDILPFAENLNGDILEDRAFRRQFRRFINGLWQEKDQLIGRINDEEKSNPSGDT